MCKMVTKRSNVNIIFSYESDHLGTAGPLANAAHLLNDSEEPFFVLNSDIIFPQISWSRRHYGMKEPGRFGAVVFNDQSGAVQKFVEKSPDFIANKVNAGLYVFNPSILKRIETCVGIWMDIGRPEDFLLGTHMYLEYLRVNGNLEHRDPPDFLGNVLIHPSVKIGSDCVIGPDVTLGPDVCIEDGVRIQDSAILSGAIIRSHSWLDGSIVGWNSDVGRWTRLENGTVLGECVRLNDEVYLNGVFVLPYNLVTASVHEPSVIL
nr:hypothetical transcript [Hymenolepis microstoma]